MSEQSEKVVYAAIDALNEQLAVGQRLSKSPMTPLLARGGKLDSLGYINLVVLLEEQCKQQCGVEISLSDASIIESNPFETITSLVNHLDGLIQKR